MKFPKSLHAEGWANHLETTKPEHLPPGLKTKAATRSVVHDETPRAAPTVAPHVSAQATPSAAATGPYAHAPSASRTINHTPSRSGVNPWIIGAGVGVVLIGLAVAVSRNLSPTEPTMPATTVVGQASTTPEDAQLQSSPPSAGPLTPSPAPEPTLAEPPAVTAPPPAAEPPRAVAAAPAEPKSQPPAVVRAAPTPPAPAPVARTLSPAPETLAQASPPPALLREPPAVQPAQPLAPPPAAVPPETVTPAVPPVAQATPQPPVANPEDAGITVKVRQALAADMALAAVPIVVSTDHGVVKLEGQAPDAQSRERATVVAAGTTGVKAVDNRLTLPPVATLGAATQSSGG